MLGLAVHVFRLVRYKASRMLERRSIAWPAAERRFLARCPTCAACGGQERLNVHHKKPFHLARELELTESNLITLCMSRDRHCHLLIGHAGRWSAYDPSVDEHAELMRKGYLRADPDSIRRVLELAKAARLFE